MNPNAYLIMAETEAEHWWFRARRQIFRHLIKGLRMPTIQNVLEVGAGTGGNLAMLSEFGAVHAVEMNEVARKIAINRTAGIFDVRAGSCPGAIPDFGKKFDLICLFDVLEHIDEDVETLSKLEKFLSQGGKILVSVPAYPWLWSNHDVNLHHKRRYTQRSLKEKVRKAGLTVTRISYFNTLLFPLVALLRLKDRLTKKANSDGTSIPPAGINWILFELFQVERFFLDRVSLPFGLSLFAVLDKSGCHEHRMD